MRKVFSALLVFAMLFSLSACVKKVSPDVTAAAKKVIEIVDEYLKYNITDSEALEKIEYISTSVSAHEDTGKYPKDSLIISAMNHLVLNFHFVKMRDILGSDYDFDLPKEREKIKETRDDLYIYLYERQP